MRVHLLDDIHLERGEMPVSYRAPNCNVVVLAGDICTGLHGVDWAKETFTQPVIYVPGNHEFWGQALINEHLAAMKALAAGSNVHVLNNETIVIDEVRFICATLWTDFNLYGNAPIAMLGQHTNDPDEIKIAQHEPFSPAHMVQEHNCSRFYISEELYKPFHGKTVVVTHHAPSELSVHERYGAKMINTAYASRLENIMLEFDPALWLHGHVHDSLDYMIGDTRVVCNPRGYKINGLLNPNFDPTMVIEI